MTAGSRPPPTPDERLVGADSDVDALLPGLQDELRKIAQAYMAKERPDHTLQLTALINEAYLRMARDDGLGWKSRRQFLAVAAQMMRRILVEHARGKNAQKRGAGWARVPFEPAAKEFALPDLHLLDLEDALSGFAAVDARGSKVVELRFFGGLNLTEIAEVLGVSKRTAEDDWYMARAWLKQRLDGDAA